VANSWTQDENRCILLAESLMSCRSGSLKRDVPAISSINPSWLLAQRKIFNTWYLCMVSSFNAHFSNRKCVIIRLYFVNIYHTLYHMTGRHIHSSYKIKVYVTRVDIGSKIVKKNCIIIIIIASNHLINMAIRSEYKLNT